MPWGRRRLGGTSGGHVSQIRPASGRSGVDSKFGGGGISLRAERPRGGGGERDARVLSDLCALRVAPAGSYQKIRVQLEEGLVEELEIHPQLGPVVYAPEGLRQFVTWSIIGAGTPTMVDHGYGYNNKPWHELTDTERETSLFVAAKRNSKLRAWKGQDFLPIPQGKEPGLPSVDALAGAQGRGAPALDVGEGEEEAERGTREFDIVVYGASGYTGQLCAQQLDMLLSLPKAQKHTWAIAGRNEEKLRGIAGRLATRPGVIVASTPREIGAMCRRCKVVLALAGPYAEFGEPVVAACVAQGTHYIDVTGEVLWIRRMIQRYHQKAKAKGVMLVFSAGQESAPYEIIAYKLVQKLGPIRQCRIYAWQFGNTSGGTTKTGIVSCKANGDPEEFRLSKEPFALGGERRGGIRRDEEEMDWVEQDQLFPALWLFPFAHSTCNVRVVRRSCHLFEKAPQLGVEYGERFLVCVRDAAPKQKPAEISLSTSAKVLASASEAEEAAKAMELSVLTGDNCPPGMGSSVEARGLFYSDYYAVAAAESGVFAHVHHTGPDTYEITAICSVSGALCMVEELDDMEPSERGGCITPGFAFHGTTWIERVEEHAMAGTKHAKCVFEVSSGRPTEADLKEAMSERSRRAMKGLSQIQKGEINCMAFGPLSG